MSLARSFYRERATNTGQPKVLVRGETTSSTTTFRFEPFGCIKSYIFSVLFLLEGWRYVSGDNGDHTSTGGLEEVSQSSGRFLFYSDDLLMSTSHGKINMLKPWALWKQFQPGFILAGWEMVLPYDFTQCVCVCVSDINFHLHTNKWKNMSLCVFV